MLRFAVHRPGNPEASPRSHGVPRRDVLRRVDVSVFGVCAGGAAEEGLALATFRCDVPAGRAGHVLDAEVLDADHVEAARDIRRGFLAPVLAAVGLAGLQTADRLLDLPPSARPAPGP